MTLDEFAAQVIERGIEAARRDYATKPSKLAGAVAGFEACRGKTPEQLRVLLRECQVKTREAQGASGDVFWYVRCFEAEVEWMCNCVSAAMVNSGYAPIVPPTARATILAAEILGVRE